MEFKKRNVKLKTNKFLSICKQFEQFRNIKCIYYLFKTELLKFGIDV